MPGNVTHCGEGFARAREGQLHCYPLFYNVAPAQKMSHKKRTHHAGTSFFWVGMTG